MPQAIPAIVGAGVSLYGANKQAKSAKAAAEATKPTPYSVSGPAGTSAVSGNNISLTQGDNPFSGLFNALGMGSLANAATAPGSALYGASPEIVQAFQGLFGQGLSDNVTHQYDLLNQLAAHGENQQALSTADRIFSKGQLGTTGGAEMFRALQDSLHQADLGRQQTALGLGRQEALDRFTGATQGTAQGMAGQQQQYNIGAGAFGGLQQILQNLFQQAGIGVSAGGGQAPGAAIYSAQAQQAPFQAINQFLQNSGLFSAGGGGNTVYPNGTVPMVSQPSTNVNIPFPTIPGL